MKKAANKRISPLDAICAAYLCLLGVALPLTVHDAYFDITRTKAFVFWILSALLLLAALLWLCFDRKGRAALLPFTLPDWLFLAFALTHILSSLLFRPISTAFFATDNRYQGILTFALYLSSFLILRRGGALSGLVRFALLLGFSIAALLGVLEIFGADVLGIRAISPTRELIRFLSTVGNVSFYGALCALFLPLSAYYALSAAKLREALPYALCALLALWGGMAARTEAFLLAALTFFAALPLLCREASVLRRVPLLWATGAAAALLFFLVMRRFSLYPPSDLTVLLCRPVLLLLCILLAMAVFLALRRALDERVMLARRIYVILFFSLFALLLLFLLLANTLWREKLPTSVASVAVFSPSWGTDRGAEWISFWQMFRASSLPQKLIGSGSGSLAEWDRARRLFSDAVTDSAHNEYLHYLLTGGLIGLGAYLALLVLALRKALRSPSRGRTAAALAVLAYAAQAAVNIAQPFTTPLFLALLALLHAERAFDEPPRGENGGLFWPVALCALAAVLLLAA